MQQGNTQEKSTTNSYAQIKILKIMKKVITLLLVLSPTLALADGITNGLGIAGDSIYKYTPAVQSLGYVIACIIGIVGAFSIYYAIQNNDPHTRKRFLPMPVPVLLW